METDNNRVVVTEMIDSFKAVIVWAIKTGFRPWQARSMNVFPVLITTVTESTIIWNTYSVHSGKQLAISQFQISLKLKTLFNIKLLVRALVHVRASEKS